jgi:hypothetical protein
LQEIASKLGLTCNFSLSENFVGSQCKRERDYVLLLKQKQKHFEECPPGATMNPKYEIISFIGNIMENFLFFLFMV